MKIDNVVMPLQPLKEGRFVSNRIVEKLLEVAPIGLNDIAIMDFTQQERVQFAQLIGYSLSGFSSLSYVDDETFGAAERVTIGIDEKDGRLLELREQIESARDGIRVAATALFKIHPDDLEV